MTNITVKTGIGIPNIPSKIQPTVPTSALRIAIILSLTVLSRCRLLNRHTSRQWSYILFGLQKNQREILADPLFINIMGSAPM
jgi:hypothetical protein